MKEKNNNKKIKISFFGGTEEVTGSNYLVEIDGHSSSGKGKTRILVDCGLFQGSRVSEGKNHDPFPYKPSSIDAVLVTHAHLDHVGRIPKLVKEGFKGKIYSTYPTKDFAKLMLIDSIGVLSKEAKKDGRNQPIYQEEDVDKAMSLWEAKNYRESFEIGGISVLFKDAGHILGSAIIEITNSEESGNETKKKKLVFSGDLGNSPEPLINPTEAISNANFMVIESTYGDRLHEDYSQADLKLERAIENIVKKKGTLMIPAFSLERTQRILYQINDLVENGRIPKIKIFLDSPLSIKATGVYKNYAGLYNAEAKNSILKGDDLFDFPGLTLTMEAEESKRIHEIAPPKIIIAGSGMCNGGRIVHHLKNYLPSKNNTLLFVSYLAVGSLGRLLHDGERMVNIMGEKISVEAEIEKIGGYSSHADLNGLLGFAAKSADTLEKVFVTHGELKSSSFLVQRLRDYLGVSAVAPRYGETQEIEI